MTQLQNVRFAHYHQPIRDTKYNGITIAYVREGKYIIYGWSLACAPDNFNKHTGRSYATNTLETNYGDMIIFPCCSYVGEFSRTGIMYCGEIFEEYNLRDIISDSTVDAMDSTDIKHAVISDMLVQRVIQVLLGHK